MSKNIRINNPEIREGYKLSKGRSVSENTSWREDMVTPVGLLPDDTIKYVYSLDELNITRGDIADIVNKREKLIRELKNLERDESHINETREFTSKIPPYFKVKREKLLSAIFKLDDEILKQKSYIDNKNKAFQVYKELKNKTDNDITPSMEAIPTRRKSKSTRAKTRKRETGQGVNATMNRISQNIKAVTKQNLGKFGKL